MAFSFNVGLYSNDFLLLDRGLYCLKCKQKNKINHSDQIVLLDMLSIDLYTLYRFASIMGNMLHKFGFNIQGET